MVLAAGGMGNAQILMASGDESSIAIGNEFDQVGRYLMEHPHLYDCARIIVSSDTAVPSPPKQFGEYRSAIIPNEKTFEDSGGLDISIRLQESELNTADYIERYVVDSLNGKATAFNLSIHSEMPPDPLNRVQLVEGKDPSGLPRLRATCVISSDVLRSVNYYLRQLGETLVKTKKGRIQINNDTIFSQIKGGGHTMGTTRMGQDQKTSVVDRNCRVHRYENLFVAGSSIFTTGGYANPTITIIALSLRLGDHLGGAS